METIAPIREASESDAEKSSATSAVNNQTQVNNKLGNQFLNIKSPGNFGTIDSWQASSITTAGANNSRHFETQSSTFSGLLADDSLENLLAKTQ